jgi:hypothetical protein
MTNEQLIQHFSSERKYLHSLMNSLSKYNQDLVSKTGKGSRAISIAYTNIETARMWIGKIQGALGAAYPYPESYDPSSQKIEAPVDVEPVPSQDFTDEISAIKSVRNALGEMVMAIKAECSSRFANSLLDSGYIASLSAIVRLGEANFAMGMRLGELYDKPKEEPKKSLLDLLKKE